MAQNVVNPKRDLCNLFKKMSDHFGSFSEFFFCFSHGDDDDDDDDDDYDDDDDGCGGGAF